MSSKESEIEQHLIKKLDELKYTYRPDIRDKASLEQNFREKFEALNYVRLTDAEFARLRDDIIRRCSFIQPLPAATSNSHYGKSRQG